jgi:hypothetical protein
MTPQKFEIEVQIRAIDLYWYFVKAFTVFPAVITLVVPLALMAYVDAQAGAGFRDTFTLAFFIVAILPWSVILLAYRGTLLKSPVKHTFSETGIASVIHPIKYFTEWSLAKGAMENRRYILITHSNGFVLLPKKQLGEAQMAAVRGILRREMKEKARLDHAHPAPILP